MLLYKDNQLYEGFLTSISWIKVDRSLDEKTGFVSVMKNNQLWILVSQASFQSAMRELPSDQQMACGITII